MADLIDRAAARQIVAAYSTAEGAQKALGLLDALPAQGVDAADAIKMGFWSAAPGEWRMGDIERVTNAILAALEPAEAGGVDAVEALVKAAVNKAVRIVLDEVGYEEEDLCENCQAALAAIREGRKDG